MRTLIAIMLALATVLAGCGEVYKQVRPYPPHKAFYDLPEFDRKVYYCLNEMRGTFGNFELGMYGRHYKSHEDMPITGEVGVVRNAIFTPIMYAGAISLLTGVGVLLYDAKFDGENQFQGKPELLIPYGGWILGSGIVVALADAMRDKIANQGQYNEWMGTQFGLAKEQRPQCNKLDDDMQRVILKTYKELLAEQQQKAQPAAATPPPSAPPAVAPPAATTPTSP